MAADGSINIDTQIDESGLKSGLAKMQSTVSKGAGAVGSLVAKGLAAATAAAAAFAAAATKAGIEFESAFAGVEKTVDATDQQLAQLRSGILDMSKDIPIAATEIAGIAEAAGQLGIETDNILGFTEVMANLGVATNLTAEEAATALARLANITQMPQTEFDKLGSTIVALGNNFATTESEIVDMSLRLAGAGKQVGMSESDIMGLSAALSSVGVQAELGGSAFSRVFTMMQLASEQGGDALQAFASVAGMSADQFKQAFEEDAANALIAFIAGLGNAEASGQSAIAVLAEMAEVEGLSSLNTVALSDVLLRAAGASDMMAEAVGVASQAWDENNALTIEATKRYETLESKLQILKNTANAFMVTVSDTWRSTCAEFVSAGTEMISTLDQAFQQGGVNGLIAALGPVLDQAVSLILQYVPTFMTVAAEILSGIASGILNNLPMLLDAAVQVISQLAQGFISALPQIASVGGQIISTLWNALSTAAPQLISAGTNMLGSLANGLQNAMPQIVEKSKSALGNFINTITTNLPSIIDSGISIITSLVSGIGDMLPDIIDAAIEVLTSFLTNLYDNLPKVIDCGIDLVGKLIEGIIGAIPKLLEALPQIIQSVVTYLVSNAPKIIVCGVELIAQLIGGILGAIPDLLAAIPQVATALVEGLWEGIKNLGGWLKDKISGFFGGVVDWVKGIFGIRSPSTVFADIGGNIVDGTYKGIEAKRSTFTSKVKGFFSGIVNGVKNVLGISSPSKLFRDAIGKNIGLGVVVGITRTKPKVADAMDELVQPEAAHGYVARMKASMAERAANSAKSAVATASRTVAGTAMINTPGAEEIASAIWDMAPEIGVDLDGEKVGNLIEPRVSRIQASKTANMNRRNGLVTA